MANFNTTEWSPELYHKVKGEVAELNKLMIDVLIEMVVRIKTSLEEDAADYTPFNAIGSGDRITIESLEDIFDTNHHTDNPGIAEGFAAVVRALNTRTAESTLPVLMDKLAAEATEQKAGTVDRGKMNAAIAVWTDVKRLGHPWGHYTRHDAVRPEVFLSHFESGIARALATIDVYLEFVDAYTTELVEYASKLMLTAEVSHLDMLAEIANVRSAFKMMHTALIKESSQTTTSTSTELAAYLESLTIEENGHNLMKRNNDLWEKVWNASGYNSFFGVDQSAPRNPNHTDQAALMAAIFEKLENSAPPAGGGAAAAVLPAAPDLDTVAFVTSVLTMEDLKTLQITLDTLWPAPRSSTWDHARALLTALTAEQARIDAMASGEDKQALISEIHQVKVGPETEPDYTTSKVGLYPRFATALYDLYVENGPSLPGEAVKTFGGVGFRLTTPGTQEAMQRCGFIPGARITMASAPGAKTVHHIESYNADTGFIFMHTDTRRKLPVIRANNGKTQLRLVPVTETAPPTAEDLKRGNTIRKGFKQDEKKGLWNPN
jgi:hypothetical protein